MNYTAESIANQIIANDMQMSEGDLKYLAKQYLHLSSRGKIIDEQFALMNKEIRELNEYIAKLKAVIAEVPEVVDDARWVPVSEKLPEYEAHAGNANFAILLLADKNGSVWAGDYTNEKFYVFGIEFPNVTHWRLWPHGPLFQKNETINKSSLLAKHGVEV